MNMPRWRSTSSKTRCSTARSFVSTEPFAWPRANSRLRHRPTLCGPLPGQDGDVDGAGQAATAGTLDGQIDALQTEVVGRQQFQRILARGDALDRQLDRCVAVAPRSFDGDVLAGQRLDWKVGDRAANALHDDPTLFT